MEAGNNFSFFHTMKHILLIYNWGNYIKTQDEIWLVY